MVNLDKIELASGARTSTYTGTDRFNYEAAEIMEVVLDLSAFATAASLTLSVEEWVASKGAYVTLLAATALTATGQKRLILGPSVPTAANASLTCGMPVQYRIVATHGNGNSHTYSITVKLR